MSLSNAWLSLFFFFFEFSFFDRTSFPTKQSHRNLCKNVNKLPLLFWKDVKAQLVKNRRKEKKRVRKIFQAFSIQTFVRLMRIFRHKRIFGHKVFDETMELTFFPVSFSFYAWERNPFLQSSFLLFSTPFFFFHCRRETWHPSKRLWCMLFRWSKKCPAIPDRTFPQFTDWKPRRLIFLSYLKFVGRGFEYSNRTVM